MEEQEFTTEEEVELTDTEEIEEVEQDEEVINDNDEESLEQDQESAESDDVETEQEILTNEFEVPDFVPDEYLPPQDFETEDDELDWYREHYGKVINTYQTDGFVNHITEKYKEKFIELEEQALHEALQRNNIYELKAKYPQLFAQAGQSPIIEQEEATNIVYENLSKIFGKDYAEKYDVEEAADPSTVSGKMYLAQQQILQQIQQHNEAVQNYKPPTREELVKALEQQYETDFKPHGVSQDMFKETVQYVENNIDNFKVLDFYKLKHFDEYLNDAYKRGKEEGKKSILSEFNRTGKKLYRDEPVDTENRPFSSKYINEFDF